MSRYFLAIGSLAIFALACSLGTSDASEDAPPEEGPSSGGVPISKATTVPVTDPDEAPSQDPQPTSPPLPTQSEPTQSAPPSNPTPPGLPDLSDRALQIVDLNVIDYGATGVEVIGLVRNSTQKDMGFGDVYFTFLDESGQEVESKLSITTMFFIPPGEIPPFKRRLPPNVPTGTEYVVVDTGFRDAPTSRQWARDGLELTPTGESVLQNVGYTVSVDVRNNTGQTVDHLNVVGIAFDANGKILGFTDQAPDIDPLMPGASLSYEFPINTGPVTDQVDRIEFIAEARLEN